MRQRLAVQGETMGQQRHSPRHGCPRGGRGGPDGRASTQEEHGPRWASACDNALRHRAKPWASDTPRVRKGTRADSGAVPGGPVPAREERSGPRWASTCGRAVRHRAKPWANDASTRASRGARAGCCCSGTGGVSTGCTSAASALPTWPQERRGTGPGGQRGRVVLPTSGRCGRGDSWRGRPARSGTRRCLQGGSTDSRAGGPGGGIARG